MLTLPKTRPDTERQLLPSPLAEHKNLIINVAELADMPSIKATKMANVAADRTSLPLRSDNKGKKDH